MKRVSALLLPLVLSLSLLLAARPALASRSATVDADNTEVREGPGPSYKAIDKLPKGAQVAASNQPIEGFYKIRTSAGVIGFVSAEVLVLQPVPSDDAPAPVAEVPPPTSSVAPSDAYKPTVSNETNFRNRNRKKMIRLKLLGGYNFFSVGDVNNLLSANVLQFGFNAGGEIDFLFTQDLAMVVRLERVFKSVFAQDQRTTTAFDMSLSSIPLMVGLELTLTNDTKFSSHFTVMGGLAMLTDLTSTDINANVPNVTEMTSTTFTGVAKFDFTYAFNKTWSAFAEAGYRYLKTGQITPSTPTTVNGSQIFQDPNNAGNYIPVSLDLSGPFVGLGVGFAF